MKVYNTGELHPYLFVLAKNEITAKSKGKQRTNTILDIDQCIFIGNIQGKALH